MLSSCQLAWRGHWAFACLASHPPPQVMNDDGHASTIKDKILTIDVQPGWKQGTKITFEKEGDQVRRSGTPEACRSLWPL